MESTPAVLLVLTHQELHVRGEGAGRPDSTLQTQYFPTEVTSRGPVLVNIASLEDSEKNHPFKFAERFFFNKTEGRECIISYNIIFMRWQCSFSSRCFKL